MSALDGTVVLDLTRLLPGAVATAMLAAQGAEVIKIERPGDSDYARALHPYVFARTNAGKRSVVIDLKHPLGRDAFLALVSGADVLIEGFRPGVMARLGLGYEELQARNPRLVYASLTGYGQTGPYATLAGHDINYLALGGVLGLNLPVIPGVQIADLAGGAMQVVNAILLALLERQHTKRGCHADVSMLNGVCSLLAIPLADYRETGHEPQPGTETLSGRYACYNIYCAGDGRWLAVGALEPKFWTELCRRLECDDLIPSQFIDECQPEAKRRLSDIFRTRKAGEWFEFLRGRDCCVTPVLTVGEAAAEMPDPPLPPPPEVGQHTREILLRAGFSEAHLTELERQGAVA